MSESQKVKKIYFTPKSDGGSSEEYRGYKENGSSLICSYLVFAVF
jgi:hypothetical protein